MPGKRARRRWALCPFGAVAEGQFPEALWVTLLTLRRLTQAQFVEQPSATENKSFNSWLPKCALFV
jgi:hypothetical protein